MIDAQQIDIFDHLVKLTSAVTSISIPWRLIALFNSATTSFPTCLQNKMKELDCSYDHIYPDTNM